MSLHRETGFQNILTQTCSALAASLGLIALLGWILKLPLLSSFGLHLIPMAPSTALLFTWMGGVIFFRTRGAKKHPLNRTALLIGCLVAFISFALLILSSQGIYTDLEYLGLQIDGKLHSTPIGHMSPVTAFSFLLVSLTFLTSLSASSASPRRVLAVWGGAGFILLINYVFVLAYFLGLPLLYGVNTIPPALPTSLAFLALGIALLANASTQQKTQETGVSAPVPHTILLVFTILALSIVTGGYLYYQNYEQQFRTQIEHQLSAITDLKVSGLVSWRSERLADANVFFRNPAFAEQVAYYLENPSDMQAQRQLQAWLEKYQNNYQYKRVALLDIHGLERISTPAASAPANEYLVEQAAAALSSGQVTFADFHRDTPDDPIHLALLVPIFAEQEDSRPLGVLFFQIDPEVYLYPFLQQWPIPSLSAETLLIRREEDAVLFLNPLRFQPDAALNLRFLLEKTEILAVKAALGQEGVVQGLDYRDTDVIGFVHAVPGSPWFIISKMGIAELYMPLRERLGQTIIFLGVLMLTAGAGLMLVWRKQWANYYRAQYETAELLRKSQEQFKGLLEQAPDGIFIANARGQYLEANSSGCAMLGYTRDEILSKRISDLVAPEDVAATPLRLDELQQGKTLLTERRLIRKDGSLLTVEISERMLQDGRFQSIVRDITERKRVEQALAESEERLRLSLRAANQGIYDLNVQTGAAIVNEEYALMLGYEPETFIETNAAWIERLHPDDKVVTAKAYTDYIDGVTSEYRVEFRQRARNGDWIWLLSLGKIIEFDSAGKPLRMLGTHTDITKRKQVEEALRDSQAQVTGIINSAMDAILTVDEDQKIIIFNPSAEQMFGCPANEAIGQTLDRFLPEYARKDHRGYLRGFGQSNSGKRSMKVSALELTCLRANGEAFASEVSISQLTIGGQKLYTAFVRDITERKQSEAALRDSEERFRATFEQAAVGIAQVGLDGRWLRVNQRLCDLVGYTSEELLPLTFQDITHPDDLNTDLDYVRQVLAGEIQTYTMEKRYVRKDRSHVWINLTVSLVCDETAAPKYFVSVIEDITKRKQAEEGLRESQENFRIAQDMSPDGFTILRPVRDAQERVVDFTWVYENTAVARLNGTDPEAVVGQRLLELFPSHRGTPFLRAYQQVAESGETCIFESSYSGESMTKPTWLRIVVVPMARDIAILAQDITERKLAENLILQEKNFNQATINSLPGLFYLFDEQGHYLRWNKNYEQVSGYSAEEIACMSPLDYFNEPDKSAIAAAIQQVFITGEVVVEANFISKDQTQRPYFFTGQLFWYDGKRCLIGMGIDITERKQVEQKLAEYSTHLAEMVDERTRELRDAQEQLVRQERLAALGQLAGSIGHELRNPLGVISNAVYFLKMAQPKASNKVWEYLDIIEKETHTSNKIITDLLNFTHIKALDRLPVSVAEIIHQTLERNPAPPSVEVHVETPGNLPQIFADAQQITQILGNLVTNAYQAMLPISPASPVSLTKKNLIISVAKQRDMLKITVKDTGPGIPPENLEKIFQPLFTTKTKGIGLGLAVSQKLVEANGGKIEVESTVGKGSAFTIYLPVYEAALDSARDKL